MKPKGWQLAIFILAAMMLSVANTQVRREWSDLYDSGFGERDYAEAITVDSDGNVYTAGWSFGEGDRVDRRIVPESQAFYIRRLPPVVYNFLWRRRQ